jgi:hypothetical protein
MNLSPLCDPNRKAGCRQLCPKIKASHIPAILINICCFCVSTQERGYSNATRSRLAASSVSLGGWKHCKMLVALCSFVVFVRTSTPSHVDITHTRLRAGATTPAHQMCRVVLMVRLSPWRQVETDVWIERSSQTLQWCE